MKYSYNWLKDLTGTKKSAEQLAQTVMLKGFELEGIEDLGKRFSGFVVGEILEINKHPNADKLQLVKVNTGENQALDIVCGAHNIKVGDKVPVALTGALIPQKKFKIEQVKIRGCVSNGMLCAEDELGLGKDHSGIMILDDHSKPGQKLSEALGLDDTILDFDVLPNRAHDCLSYNGMANEIGAMEGRKFKIQNSKLKIATQKSELLSVEIKEEELCPRYMGAVMSGVKVKPSPRWMQNRLIASGMEPINNIVDITNYVMLEIGNPLHCFDFDKIKTENQNSKSQKVRIVVRKAEKREDLELLDETKLKLDENDLVIANEERALALAGIKGGKYSGISNETKTIVLESANFNPFNIRKTRQRHSLVTEAQARYEKGISPVLTEKALARAVELFEKYAQAKLVQTEDENFHKKEKETITLEFQKVEKLLGEKIEEKEALKILENLGFKLKSRSNGKAVFEIPYWRLDIEGPEDLAEEIGRIVGYEKIKEKAVQIDIETPEENRFRKFEWKVKDLMAGLGFDEVINYSFYGEKEMRLFGISGDHFELENPLTKEHTVLRKTLLPCLAANLESNQKYFEKLAVFELGRAYLIGQEGTSEEKMKLAGAVFEKGKRKEIFYDMKGRLESLAEALGLGGETLVFEASGKIKYLHPKKAAQVFLENKSIGVLGEFSPEVCGSWHLEGNAGVFEMDFEELFKAYDEKNKNRQYQPVSKFPLVLRDISMFIDCQTEAGIVEKIVRTTGGKLLRKLELFDVYWDKKSDKKSLAFHLEFGSNKRTLKSEEADDIMQKIIQNLEKAGVQVRTS